jgi:hypothetical protein
MQATAGRTERGWVTYVVLGALAVLGAAAGLYLSDQWESKAEPPLDRTDLRGGTALPFADLSHKFWLAARDVKDQIEAPSLTADDSGVIYLVWASKTQEAERTIFLTRTFAPGQSFRPQRAVAPAGVYRNAPKHSTQSTAYEPLATPHIAAVGKQLYLTWSEALPDGSSMRLVAATSTDAGTTFGPPLPVHSGDRARPTFTGLAVDPGGGMACTWLDDRAGFQQPYVSTRPAGQPAFNPEQLVHPGQENLGVCPCCPTDAVFAPEGTLYVAFRNIRDGYRDIAVSRKKADQAQFEAAVPVIPPAWKFDGCPHDGPSLAVADGVLHIVWMDARSGPQRCYYARSKLGELKFEARALHPIDSGTQGNARLFADAAGALHAVWEESTGAEPESAQVGHSQAPPKFGTGAGRSILYAHMPAGTSHFGPPRTVAPQTRAFQTRPAIVGTRGGDLYIAWNELSEEGKAVAVCRLAPGGPP